ncbi:hypothetical protein EPUS_05350 [Endocarpon pusillum Z07020]|uniref:Heterokaryon incompatibility domain-containing protein n=1 Tax=Endocarpon pusillum (strain Z07020 / HMAS-L-300199) TaxID=1263415 RepID=U1G8Y0_ENDPU|nr:uncharacterized protein EPUS_05350 [Endocarpon pusillum Z07020]ERF73927.1 hypothetical protein EPUS_05350 [Endocarpon pusillum Z07020]
MDFFRHHPLENANTQLGILTLKPAQSLHAPLICSIETHNFGDHLEYEALSYVWGSTLQTSTIMLNEKKFSVTRTLEGALRYLRKSSNGRRLWIDTISINQNDFKEKNAQVLRIRDIFAGALEVLIWLGEPDMETEGALRYITTHYTANEDHDWPDRWDPEFIQNLPCLQKLFSNPWWSRMWTLQEIVVANFDPIFLCGNVKCYWSVLHSCAMHLFMLTTHTYIPFNVDMEPLIDLGFIANRWKDRGDRNEGQKTGVAMNIENLLITSAARGATDPRDHIYAILGLLEASEHSITTDYDAQIKEIY